MSRVEYFRDGRPIAATDALDEKGCIRDRVTARTRMMLRDSAGLRDGRSRGALRISDGTNSPFCLNKPGWRVDAAGGPGGALLRDQERELIADARSQYIDALTSAWQNNPPTGVGEHASRAPQDGRPGRPASGVDGELYYRDAHSSDDGEDDRDNDDADENDSRRHTLRQDDRSIAQMMRDHQQSMDKLYAARDRELSEEWRK